jgi:ubiquinone/menaquinone biosynthesis C-methylase UbiE
MSLARVRRSWERLAEEDPFWAVLVDADKSKGRWDLEQFFQSGVREIDAAMVQLDSLGGLDVRERALDFGAGLGRVTNALARHFDYVLGVDISRKMLDLARLHNRYGDRCQFVLNERDDLSIFAEGEFDLAYSGRVLQHVHPSQALAYLEELLRVVRPGGALVFQLPDRPRWTLKGMAFRFMPPALIGFAQQAVFRYPAPMEMHGIPRQRVLACMRNHGATVLDAITDSSAGPDWYSFTYFVRKRG